MMQNKRVLLFYFFNKMTLEDFFLLVNTNICNTHVSFVQHTIKKTWVLFV
jgi:hypothetical protein